MSLDSTVTLRQVTIRAVMLVTDPADPTGDPIEQDRTGQVTFTPSVTNGRLLAQTATPPTSLGVTGRPVPFTAGAASAQLQTTDDADFNPTGWTWHVEFDFTDGGPAWPGFDFALPAGDGSTLDLTVVTPVSASGGVPVILGPVGPAPALTFMTPTTVAAGQPSTVTSTEVSPGVYQITLGLTKGDKGDVGPAGLTWDDAHPTWDPTKQYAVYDAVYYQGSSYWAAQVPAVGVAPDPASSDPWELLAIQGSQGVPGSDHLYWTDNGDGTGALTTDGDQSYPSTSLWAGSVSGAFTPDLTQAVDQEWTLVGDLTLTLPIPALTGATITLSVSIVQDSTGGRAITWDPAVKWPSGIAPALPTTAGGESDLIFRWSPNLGWRGFVAGAAMAAA